MSRREQQNTGKNIAENGAHEKGEKHLEQSDAAGHAGNEEKSWKDIPRRGFEVCAGV